MDQQVIDRLKEEAKKNKAFHAIASVWAARQRARNQVTVHTLKATMDNEGHRFEKEEYERALYFLGSLGFGDIKKSNTGRVRELKNIKVKLQDIGKVATSKSTEITPLTEKKKYDDLVGIPHKTLKQRATDIQEMSQSNIDTEDRIQTYTPGKDASEYSVSLEVTIKGEKIVFGGPICVTPQQLGFLLIRFNEITSTRK